MSHVVFVSPFYLGMAPRFVAAIANVPGVRLSLIRQGGMEGLGPALRQRVQADYRVDNAFDAEQLCRAVSWLGERIGPVDRLVGTFEQLQVPLGDVRDRLGIAGMGGAAARNFRDKDRMKEVLAAAGLPVARHRRLQSLDDAVDFARSAGYPLVVKPLAGAGAVATVRVNNEAELRAFLQKMRPSASNPVQCEEFIVGIERSFEVVCVDGDPVFHSLTRYDPPPLQVLENPWIQWTVLLPREVEHPAYDETRKVGFAAVKALGMQTGISHMEWFRRRDGSIVIGEIAARPPGAQILSLMSFAHDTDFLASWAALVATGAFEVPPRRFAVGAAFFRGQGPGAGGQGGRIVAVHGLDRAQREIGHLVVDARLPQVGQFSNSSYEGEGFAIVRHADTAVVEQALRTLVSTVRVEVA